MGKISCSEDRALVKFFQNKPVCQANYLKLSLLKIPSGEKLSQILEDIDLEADIIANEIKDLDVNFATTDTFSQLRNHIHFVHALGAQFFELVNFSLGFDPTVAFEGKNIPHLHLTYPKPPKKTLRELWTQIFKDLDENKIFYCRKEDLAFSIPIFLITQTNNFGQEKKRLINNFSPLAHLIKTQPFKLNNVEHLARVAEGALVLILDIKSAYPTLQLLYDDFLGFLSKMSKRTLHIILGRKVLFLGCILHPLSAIWLSFFSRVF